MKKVFDFIFSYALMGIILLAFSISIGYATFIENDFGTSTAQAAIYQSWWFDLMLFLGMVNLSGIIIRNKMYRKEKFTLFVFHLAFLIILIGAAITRFIGYEGTMHIRQGDTSSTILSGNSYLYAEATSNGKTAYDAKKMLYSAFSKNYHKLVLTINNQKATVECLEFLPNASQTVVDSENGHPIMELVIAGGMGGRNNIFLESGQRRKVGMIIFSFNDTTNTNGVNFTFNDSGFTVTSAFVATRTDMASQKTDTLPAGKPNPFLMRSLYSFGGLQVVAKSFNPSGKLDVQNEPNAPKGELPSALRIKITVGSQTKTLVYMASQDAYNQPLNAKVGNVDFSISYGSRPIALPFSMKLDTFILKHYPGSNSPSWFESKITLIDPSRNINEDRRIFMNNVLNYRGYRFYQSSYDQDEGGTILSVNRDLWGTLVTYAGYLLMALGMALSLLNPKSRFKKLSKEINNIKELKKAATAIGIVFLLSLAGTTNVSAQKSVPDSLIIPKRQAELFGKLLIQSPEGRIMPINTLSSELLRKIYRNLTYEGQNSDQVLLGMITYPHVWQALPMIRISHPDLKELLRTSDNYVSFSGLFSRDANHEYILGPYVSEAFRKKPADRTKFDTELIRLDERANLCYTVYMGQFLRIFPKPNDPSNTWYTPETAGKNFAGEDSTFVNSVFSYYLTSLISSMRSNNWKEPEELLDAMSNFQTKFGKAVVIPTGKIKAEIFYNKLNIFERLISYYFTIGFVLLILQLISMFSRNFNIKIILKIALALLILGAAFHGFGLAIRWYLSGHAPWSNGYESLIYIGFATMVAGLLFSRKSGLTLSTTAILASIILFVAHLSWMDPQITNLVPVLQSYWLVIHVATITASYAFLALGAILAFVNLVVMFLQSQKNYKFTDLNIAEVSNVIEMTLITGLYMLTVGTFLGGVWANESWGRYWGWDPKETWALSTVLVYAFVAHMRMIPGFRSRYLFNVASLVSFSWVIMTYFGVNYYLSGLHSYAKGDRLPVPTFVYYTITVVVVVILASWINQRSLRKKIQSEN